MATEMSNHCPRYRPAEIKKIAFFYLSPATKLLETDYLRSPIRKISSQIVNSNQIKCNLDTNFILN